MTEDIRETHYNAWRKGKEFIDIEVNELDTKDGWIGKCKSKYGFVIYRDTKQQTVYAMQTELAKRGCEVGNLPEVFGIGS